jgi:hypothetical protein
MTKERRIRRSFWHTKLNLFLFENFLEYKTGAPHNMRYLIICIQAFFTLNGVKNIIY